MERGGTQGISFVIQVILARILVPEQFGLIAIVMVFVNIAQVFIQSGFSMALIQKKDSDLLDFSSVFYLNIVVAAIFYILIYFTAPIIATIYENVTLIALLRVLSLILFTGALNSIQNAFISKKLMFRELFKSHLISIILSGILGIILALNNFGIWAIVAQQLSNQVIICLILWNLIDWKPSLVFSFNRITKLFSFGWKVLLSSLINIIYMDIRTLLIGGLYSSATLGYYNRGQQFPKFFVNNIDSSIQAVLLPTLSAHQENIGKVKKMVSRSMVTSSFVLFPMMIGMAIIAEPLVELVLTDKWLPAVPFLQIYSFIYALTPLHTSNIQAMNALGRSDIVLKLEVIKKILGLTVLMLSIQYGIYAIALGQLLSNIVSTFINAYPNKKLLNYSYKNQINDILPSLIVSSLMGASIYVFVFIDISVITTLVLQVVLGFIIYISIAKIFKLEILDYLINVLKNLYFEK